MNKWFQDKCRDGHQCIRGMVTNNLPGAIIVLMMIVGFGAAWYCYRCRCEQQAAASQQPLSIQQDATENKVAADKEIYLEHVLDSDELEHARENKIKQVETQSDKSEKPKADTSKASRKKSQQKKVSHRALSKKIKAEAERQVKTVPDEKINVYDKGL